MSDRQIDYGDVANHVHVHATGHQIGQGNGGAVIMTLIIAMAFLIALAMVLVFGIAVMQMLGDVVTWILGGLR